MTSDYSVYHCPFCELNKAIKMIKKKIKKNKKKNK